MTIQTTPTGADRTGSYLEPSFERNTDYLDDRLLADPSADWPVEADRYRLVVARACPWANRAMIVRRLLGLEDAMSMGVCGPTHDWQSWTFDLDDDGLDPVLRIPRLRDAFLARIPDYDSAGRGITVPAVVDVPSGQVVTNDFAQMTIDWTTQWTAHHRDGVWDLWPDEHRDELVEVVERIYHTVNNGVYKCGFAADQAAYEKAYAALWDTMDWLEERLTTQRFLVGDTITLADVRLFTTLVRFDAVYHGHFKTNRNKLSEMDALWAYARDLFQTPGFGDTVHFPQIKDHYYLVHQDVNPSGVVPLGPDVTDWAQPHGREALGGRPFGDGSAPGPVPAGEVVPHDANPALALLR